MLVLARKVGQSIVIGDNITLVVVEVRNDQVRLGFEAPREIEITRKELLNEVPTEAEAPQDASRDEGVRRFKDTPLGPLQ